MSSLKTSVEMTLDLMLETVTLKSYRNNVESRTSMLLAVVVAYGSRSLWLIQNEFKSWCELQTKF